MEPIFVYYNPKPAAVEVQMKEEEIRLLLHLTEPFVRNNTLIDYQELQHCFPGAGLDQLQYYVLKHFHRPHRHEPVHRWAKYDTQILVSAMERHRNNWYYVNDKLFTWMNIRQLKNRYYQITSTNRKHAYVYDGLRDSMALEVSNDLILRCIATYIQ